MLKKNSKKQNVQRCTLDDFAGEFKYLNCEGAETKVNITCGPNQCQYKERSIDDDSDDGCVVHGSFDITQIQMDPTRTGVCQLDFVPLKNSCDADAFSDDRYFGMKAEVDVTTSHDATSSMLLWFSNDDGLVYYNEANPRVTAFLSHDLPPRRKMEKADECDCFSSYPLNFPDKNVYDRTKWTSGKDLERADYMKNIKERCDAALPSTTTAGATCRTRAERLACELAVSIDTESSTTPFALGPMRLSQNLLDAATTSGYVPNVAYTPIFNSNIIAELISNKCIRYSKVSPKLTTAHHTYSDASSYKSAMVDKGMVDVSVDASYGGFSASAGFTESTATSRAGSERKGFAYGQTITESTYATLDITCFTKEKFALYGLNVTILPKVVDHWNSVRSFDTSTSIAELQKTTHFKEVAKGFSLPRTYAYTAAVGITKTTKYTSSNSDSSKKVKDAIKLSLTASYGVATGSASAGEDTSMKTKLSASNIDSETTGKRFITGVAGDPSCLDATTSGRCETTIENAVAAIGNDVSLQTVVPSKYTAHVSINEIVKGYFNDNLGLGAQFLQAVDEYYSYKECSKPMCPNNSAKTITLVNGSGKQTKVSDDSCGQLPNYATICFPDRKEFINPQYREHHKITSVVKLCEKKGGKKLESYYLACPDNQYYVPDEHFCYWDGGSQHCWYPEDKFPVGDMWGSGGTKPFNECGQKCRNVCDHNEPCE